LQLAQWGKEQFAPEKIWLAGFSFGSYVALRAHQRLSPNRLILVAPPIPRFATDTPALSSKIPTLVLQGNADDVVEPDSVKNWVAAQTSPPQLLEFPNADHFFHGKLPELRSSVTQWMQQG